MKKYHFLIVLGVVLLVFGTSLASDRINSTEGVPAILASLDKANVTTLDDTAIADIRGQASYIMVKIPLINTWDFSRDVGWTLNPLNWRYGNWGGAGYGDEGVPVDDMDNCFMMHDQGTYTDQQLVGALIALPGTLSGDWGGLIYDPDGADEHFDYSVYVSKTSWLPTGGSFRRFSFWREMPLTEYARRQAILGMTILTFLAVQ